MISRVAAHSAWSARKLLVMTSSGLALVVGASLADTARAADATVTADATAGPANPDAATADYGTRVSELVVTSEVGGAVAAEPVKAPLQAIEPTAIVTREAIDQFVPQTSDYSQVIDMTPSMTGTSQYGPGLGEAKATPRGFGDGQYNVTYDGIPFGDTNDFTHHTTSFFPASNIGAASVERGPGQAGQLGEATFGGSVNLFSPEVSDEFGASEQLTAGSWNTYQSIAKLNTGDIQGLHNTHAFIALQQTVSDTPLTKSGVWGVNEMIRTVTPIKDSWTLTLFSTVNYTHVYQDDNNGATRAQVALYGKDFANTTNQFFPGTSPATQIWPGTYYKFNIVSKHTDFEYARLAGDITPTTHFEDTGYTYYYDNFTISAQDVTGSAALGTHQNDPNIVSNPTNVPGYTKLNHYRVWGDVLRLTQDFSFGTLKAGFWYDHADTHRARLDYDLTAGLAAGNLLGVPDFHDKTKSQTPPMTAPANILYDQNSTFDTIQPFVDFEWKPIPELTITPGLKYVDFSRAADGPFNQGTRNAVRQSDNQSKLLYFATINYRIMPNWSVYGQYATGFLQAPLSVLQNAGVNTTALKPQQTTNYQLGTVYQSSRLTVDADLYYIAFNNLISSFTGTSSFTGAVCPTNETCYENVAGATYKGFEGQATLGLTDQLFVFANGSYNSATNNRTKLQISGAPQYTAAGGFIWTYQDLKVSLLDKVVGDNHQVDATCVANSGACVLQTDPTKNGNLAAYNFYHLPAYNQLDLTGTYKWGHFRFQAAIYNLLNSQQVYQIKANSKANASATTSAGQFDQMYFQAPTNFQFSVRYTF
jgi:iron complex outermembrane receptor protein